jgi:hypothetical protein
MKCSLVFWLIIVFSSSQSSVCSLWSTAGQQPPASASESIEDLPTELTWCLETGRGGEGKYTMKSKSTSTYCDQYRTFYHHLGFSLPNSPVCVCVGGGGLVNTLIIIIIFSPSLSPAEVQGLLALAVSWSLLFLVSHFRLIREISSTEAWLADLERWEDSGVHNNEKLMTLCSNT